MRKFIAWFIQFTIVGFIMLVIASCIFCLLVLLTSCTLAPQKDTNLYELKHETCELVYLNDHGYHDEDASNRRDLQEQAYKSCGR